jgi:hypothetical protein
MRSWTTSATMSLSRCGRCRRVVWTSNHFSALLEACRRRCIHAPLRTHACKCGALGRAELPTVLLTHCRMERSRRKWPHRLTDRCRAYCFIGLASLSFPKRSRNRQCPTRIVRYAPQTRVGSSVAAVRRQGDNDGSDRRNTRGTHRRRRPACSAPFAESRTCAEARLPRGPDYHCIRRLHARIALTDSLGVQARLHPAVQRRLVLGVHRFRALSARRSRRACRQAPCVHSEADARARTHCPRGWFLAIIGRLGRVCGPCHRGEPRALHCTALRPFVDAVDCRGVQ